LTSRTSTAAPNRVVPQVVLGVLAGLLASYVAAYFVSCDLVQVRNVAPGRGVLRVYRYAWQIEMFTPVARVEAMARSTEVALYTRSQAQEGEVRPYRMVRGFFTEDQ
jgi:hypothetical protein